MSNSSSSQPPSVNDYSISHHSFIAVIFQFFRETPALFVSLLVGIISGLLWRWSPLVGSILIILLSLYTFVIEIIDIVAAFREGHAGTDILAAIAIVSTTLVGAFWGVWIIDVMIFTGSALENFVQNRAQDNLRALLDAAPQTAHRLTNFPHDYDIWETVPVDNIQLHDFILVKPGETVPVDGTLMSEQATLDLSAINGEPVPGDFYKGSHLVSGAVNGAGALILQATATSADSQYQKILDLVRSAQDSRASVVKTADVLAVPFTILSLIIAVIAWICSHDPVRFAQVLVLATPCPLLIGAPVAYMGGTGRLAKSGIVIKSQEILETLGRVSHIFFDKTGTLTHKRPEVTRIDRPVYHDNSISDDTILFYAGAVESYSTHILATGIFNAAERRLHELHQQSFTAHHLQEIPGKGISGEVDGHIIAIGRLSYLVDFVDDPASLTSFDQQPLAANEMATYIAIDHVLSGRLILQDTLRENSKQTIDSLQSLGIDKISIITGDTEASAKIIADEIGISDIHAGLLPENKVDIVAQCHQKDASVITMMVGDGVNDAPVLASANIGVAMADGSSTAASESAQVVIMNDNLEMIPQAITIARQTKRTMLQACIGGIVAALILMVFAAFNFIPVVIGALLQEAIDACSIGWAFTALHNKN